MKRGLRSALLTAAGVVLLAAPVLAEEHGGAEAAHGGDAAAWTTLGFTFVNFTIFLVLAFRYGWPALKDFLANRRKEVVDAMAAAEAARREADAIRAEFAVKEAALEETRRQMLEEIRRGAAIDRDKALAEAEASAARLRKEAEKQAEHDLAHARRELRAEAARLAADLAEKEIRSRMTDADRARLVREFVEGVERQ